VEVTEMTNTLAYYNTEIIYYSIGRSPFVTKTFSRVDKKASRRNGKSAKWQVDEMAWRGNSSLSPQVIEV
jgi:hypothetical protein